MTVLQKIQSPIQKHRNSVFFFSRVSFIILIFALPVTHLSNLYGQIVDDGGIHHAESGATDYILPMNPLITDITFNLKGGDGGYARVYDKYFQTVPVNKTVHVSYKANGGEGAQVSATFPVGDGPNEIPVGSIIRLVGKGVQEAMVLVMADIKKHVEHILFCIGSSRKVPGENRYGDLSDRYLEI